MSTTPRIAFLASQTDDAQAALAALVTRHGQCEPDAADVLCALGGDGFMLQTLHRTQSLGVPVFGMKQPPILKQISEYELSAAQAYDPKLLARTPAALYDVDFDAASLTARSHITATMRERYERGGSGQSLDVKVYANVLQMTFTLLLVPVWIATLYERDGEIRAAVVNGQTGAVALGDSRKP